ncbi:hypothetical protein BGZ93_011172 [Podila epicladia]|nr:hypothetical protein BGZ92_002388 [Podila epicladia]KAG0087079.1 hypothetical protein BGZ93_011172 [Podila epicladia]
MPATIINATSDKFLDDIQHTVATNADKKIYAYFYGHHTEETGKSWCPDCVRSDPIVLERFAKADNNVVLVSVDVGDRATWKDPAHHLRHNKDTRLVGIPTLLRWNHFDQRIEDESIEKAEVLDKFLSL